MNNWTRQTRKGAAVTRRENDQRFINRRLVMLSYVGTGHPYINANVLNHPAYHQLDEIDSATAGMRFLAEIMPNKLNKKQSETGPTRLYEAKNRFDKRVRRRKERSDGVQEVQAQYLDMLDTQQQEREERRAIYEEELEEAWASLKSWLDNEYDDVDFTYDFNYNTVPVDSVHDLYEINGWPQVANDFILLTTVERQEAVDELTQTDWDDLEVLAVEALMDSEPIFERSGFFHLVG